MRYVSLRYMLHVQKCVVCVSGALCELCDGITRDWKVVVGIDIEGLPCSFRILTKY